MNDTTTERREQSKESRSNGFARRRNLLRWTKRLLGLLFLGAVIALLVFAWMPKPVPVELSTATRGTLRVTVDEDGRTRVKDRYIVSMPLTGNAARIELDPGDRVERGDILARVVPLASPLLDERTRQTSQAQVAAATASERQAAAQIERARTALEFAERELERQKKLFERGATSEEALDQATLEAQIRKADLASAKFAARVARYEVEMAQAALGRVSGLGGAEDEQMIVPSPIEGMVLKVLQKSEGVLQAGSPLLELGDPSALEIVVDLLTSDAIRVNPGAKTSIERWGGEPLEGRVRLVEPSAFTRISSLGVEEQRVNTIIELTSPRDKWKSLRDGYRVETRIVVWEKDGVLTVPGSAVFRHGDGWAVFAVKDGIAKLTPVEVGERNSLEVQVLAHLEEGARVVAHPSDRVEDGVQVAAR